jgi:hypothetical protein
MKENYSFLKDELALLEIRKHKWLESEKYGYELGFATCALDWINRYGAKWIASRDQISGKQDLFLEKRQYRRFYRQLPIQINIENKNIGGQTYDINLVGVSCTLMEPVPANTVANVTLRFPRRSGFFQKLFLRFPSKVLRIAEAREEEPFRCNIFLPFNEEIRNYLRANPELLSSI